MAIYHCSIKSISRGAGQSIVAAAAYRHACKLEDMRTGEVHDYTRKKGIESSEIYFPFGVNPEWATDRGQLWSAVESAEKRVNSRLGRDVVLALPSELSAVQRRELAGEMARHLADRYGVVVDVAIHQPSRDGDQRNHHAHMLMSSRRITTKGFGEKARELDDKERGPAEVEHIRATWADMANRTLERAGQHIHIDHRSLKAQGVKRLASLHLGPSASAMERRGIATRIGDRNRTCGQVDAPARHLEAEQRRLQDDAQKQAQEASRTLEPTQGGEEAVRQPNEPERASMAQIQAAIEDEDTFLKNAGVWGKTAQKTNWVLNKAKEDLESAKIKLFHAKESQKQHNKDFDKRGFFSRVFNSGIINARAKEINNDIIKYSNEVEEKQKQVIMIEKAFAIIEKRERVAREIYARSPQGIAEAQERKRVLDENIRRMKERSRNRGRGR